jgi:putative heme-binding domain-containing protein
VQLSLATPETYDSFSASQIAFARKTQESWRVAASWSHATATVSNQQGYVASRADIMMLFFINMMLSQDTSSTCSFSQRMSAEAEYSPGCDWLGRLARPARLTVREKSVFLQSPGEPMSCRPLLPSAALALTLLWLSSLTNSAATAVAQSTLKQAVPAAHVFARDNLVAWCIVPFDDRERTPEERAAMLARLGIKRYAYDYRAKHIPTFDAEIEACKRHGVELTAWWFPTSLNDEAKRTLAIFEKHGVTPQLWITGSGAATKSPEEQAARVKAEAARIRPIAEAAAKIGCQVALYNHGGWFGEPENQIAIINELQLPNVGIVYNQHHGHGHVDRFAELLKTMQPHLLALNLNGMIRNGDQHGQKIVPLGEGELDLRLLKIIRDSGYTGPIGILNHTQENAEARLQDNLDGLNWLLPQLDGKPAGEKPTLRTWSTKRPAPPATVSGTLLEGRAEYRSPPITVECRITAPRHEGFNIFVASDTKASGAHWEIFSFAGNGFLTAYLPGMSPDHVRSQAMICDGKPHNVVMIYEASRVRLFSDGTLVADQKIETAGRATLAGGLAIGRLVEGGIGSSGPVDWVRISRGVREIASTSAISAAPPAKDGTTLLLWERGDSAPENATSQSTGADDFKSPVWSQQLVDALLNDATEKGDAHRGAIVFSSPKFACLQCHKIGEYGGSVGPALTKVAAERKAQYIVESLLWPKREVRPEFVSHLVVTDDGRVHKGYRVGAKEQPVDDKSKPLVLRDPASGEQVTIPRETIDDHLEAGTLMPEGLLAAMTSQQRLDVLKLVLDLGRAGGTQASDVESIVRHAQAHGHGPAKFAFDRKPVKPEMWANWQHPVNRDRVYDFYRKEAAHFRAMNPTPPLLPKFPGLDGGDLGHWGNQNEDFWKDARWNDAKLGSLQAGVFRNGRQTIARGVCVKIDGNFAGCFNPDTLQYEASWGGGFLKFSEIRHGFVSGILMDGEPYEFPHILLNRSVPEGARYRGFYRSGTRVAFSYEADGTVFLDTAVLSDGKFQRTIAPVDEHPSRDMLRGGPAQWPQVLETPVVLGKGEPYAVDTIVPPFENPWNAPLFFGGHDFLPDGSALVCTMQGDVWHVSGFEYPSKSAKWRRFASGLHHALGLVIDDDGIFVLGRDQITRLHDLNNDGEADFYECFSNVFETSPAGHDFICGLQRDHEGNFYIASGNQGIVKIAADGQSSEVIATGFRNPDGLGLYPDGVVTVPCSEGSWTPASMLCAVRPGISRSPQTISPRIGGHSPQYFGYGGPRDGRAPDLPFLYLPRGLDNSAGGQIFADSNRWGPLSGNLVHLSFGAGTHFLVLRDEVNGQLQGAAVPLPGEFRSGAHRGRFNPKDGQLYVSGMQGWGSYTPDDGNFERVRYTGGRVQQPVGFHLHENGVVVTFNERLDPAVATKTGSHFAQAWNYRYSGAYGSPEFSAQHVGTQGHDVLPIKSAHILKDRRTLFLELPDLQPVNVLHLLLQPEGGADRELFITAHQLDKPFTEFPGYVPVAKTITAHPMVADLLFATRKIPNPFQKKLKNAREVTIATAGNLSYATRSLTVKAGEPIRFTLQNPDVVPHNWALIKPGTLYRVGDLANKLISNPESAARQYIPESSDVLFYTDVVPPREEFSINFEAPDEPGRYPFLCTFPGHWLVMNGEMIVEPAD